MKISLPNEINLKHINYNTKMPQEYFDDLSKRLSKYDIIFNGFIIEDEWKGNNTLTSIECEGNLYNNYRINKLYRYIKRMDTKGYQKPKGFNLTPELLVQNVNDECIKRGGKIEFIGYKQFNGAKTYLELKCNDLESHDEPYEWCSTIYDSFVGNNRHLNGCHKCSGRYHYTIEELNNNINYFCETRGFVNPVLITNETMNGVNSIVSFTCHCGEKATMTYDSLSRARFCILCSEGSYKQYIPGSLYVLEVYKNDKHVAYKFGISNYVPKRLMEYGKSPCNVKIIHQYDFEDGSIPYKIENKIKNSLPIRYLTKNEFGVGYTETIDTTLYEDLINIIKKGA